MHHSLFTPTRRLAVLLSLAALLLLGCKFTQQVMDPSLPTFPAAGTVGALPTWTLAGATATTTLGALPTFLPPPTETPTPTPTETPLPTDQATLRLPPLSGPGVFYSQDFTGEAVEWSTGVDEDPFLYSERDFSEGMYRWNLSAKQDFFTMQQPSTLNELPEPFFQFSARVIAAEAARDLAYGLAFSINDDEFYYFKVSQSGDYALYYHSRGEFETLIETTESEDIRSGASAANWLAVVVRGDLIELYINGVLQDSLADSTVRGGGMGLTAELFAGQSATVYFDDVVVCDKKCE